MNLPYGVLRVYEDLKDGQVHRCSFTNIYDSTSSLVIYKYEFRNINQKVSNKSFILLFLAVFSHVFAGALNPANRLQLIASCSYGSPFQIIDQSQPGSSTTT